MVAVDLDGTLLDSSKRVSEQTVQALRCLPGAGVQVLIASARPPRSVRHIYRQLQLSNWQVNYNGALIWDEPNSRVIYHRPIAAEIAREIVEAARDLFPEVLVHAEVLDKWYPDRIDASHTTETGKLFKPDAVVPIDQCCREPVTKLMLLGAETMLQRLEPMLLERFGDRVTIVHADEDLLQIMDKRVSKALAVKKVASHFGIMPQQIMAIGDAPNDVGMLQMAGVAVAMDNAHTIVKKIAHWVAPSNNNHGVHAALRRFGLCE
jgi:5-amino-6-(5-phospho-D-ribitylamino)uracil phosphatase